MMPARRCSSFESQTAKFSQCMFLQRERGRVRVSRSNLPHALSANEFCGHDQLLWRESRFLDSADRKFSQMYAEFFWELAHSRQPRMQDFTNCVIEAGNADVLRNSDSRLLQSLVNT